MEIEAFYKKNYPHLERSIEADDDDTNFERIEGCSNWLADKADNSGNFSDTPIIDLVDEAVDFIVFTK